MTTFNLRLSEDEKRIFKLFANNNGMTLSEALKEALWEKIEDLEDIRIYEEWLEKEKLGENKYITHDELKDELGL